MNVESYVVTLIGDDIDHAHKHFTTREAARHHALEFAERPEIERVDIFKMDGCPDAVSAIAARARGEGEIIESKAHQLSKAETKRAIHKAGGLFKLLGLGKRKPPMKRRL
jgi:hypothetical protein